VAVDARLIDGSAPWLDGWRELGREVLAHGGAVHQGLDHVRQIRGVPAPRFVAQSALPAGRAYEAHVAAEGECPTRDNLHDLLNGLCWLRFPATKRALNRLQSAEIAVAGVQAERGPVRDALTLLDENGAVLLAPPALWAALLARDWRHLFGDLRPLWSQARLTIFGHALLEKLVQPRKSLTAHVYIAQAAMNSIADQASMDDWLSRDLSAPHMARKPFTPLPLMGVPGWSPANEDPSFYDDPAVFRPPRLESGRVP
jgi:hypothetical protein